MESSINYDEIFVGRTIKVDVLAIEKDIIIVSFTYRSTLYQGAVFATGERKFPCGVCPPDEIKNNYVADDTDTTRLFSTNQRYTYQNGEKSVYPEDEFCLSKNRKSKRLGVRLRPRQVLCSKCQSVCNDLSLKGITGSKAKPTCQSNNRVQLTEAREQEMTNEMVNNKSLLVPKLIKLSPCDIAFATKNSPTNINTSTSHENKENTETKTLQSGTSKSVAAISKRNRGKRRKKLCWSRNKKSKVENISSKIITPEKQASQDSDESNNKIKAELKNRRASVDIPIEINEKNSENASLKSCKLTPSCTEIPVKIDYNGKCQLENTSLNEEPKTIPVLKISFGPEGRGTVMKIKSKGSSDLSEDCENEFRQDINVVPESCKKSKSNKKKRIDDIFPSMESSPSIRIGGASPARFLNSPRKAVPLSPLYPRLSPPQTMKIVQPYPWTVQNIRIKCPPPPDPQYSVNQNLETVSKHRFKKHKHKLKHKRKHKEHSRRSSYNGTDEVAEEGSRVKPTRHKLSISLRRLSNEHYVACGTNCSPLHSLTYQSRSPNFQTTYDTSESTDVSLERRCQNILNFRKGTVVWGKIDAHWWPAKVIHLRSKAVHDGTEAIVQWFGSEKQSCLQLDDIVHFQDMYQKYYCPEMNSLYQNAVQEAKREAELMYPINHQPEVSKQSPRVC